VEYVEDKRNASETQGEEASHFCEKSEEATDARKKVPTLDHQGLEMRHLVK